MSVPAPAYPPAKPFVFPEIPGFTPPGVLIPPPLPGPPPCDGDECEPPPPPTDMPEPGTLFILLVGAAALAFGMRAKRPATVVARRGGKLTEGE